ncbi:MAG TPA: carbohydrate binding domain-containing protein [Pilimelia sp.]|nr:carbohydrate binding domain-containing protein [Pilimelia sp.]
MGAESRSRYSVRRWCALTVALLLTMGGAMFAGPPAAVAGPAADAAGARHGGGNPHAREFVTRSGTGLTLGGAPFRFGGPNIYWLGLDENVGGVDYPTRFRIDDALRTAKAMGSTVVRSHTLGISTGTPLSIEPSLGEFNADAFATIDYAIAQAHRLGLRLLIPLTDNWSYYHGGFRDFTTWLGLPESAFYTDPRAVAAFKEYIAVLLNHVNPITGRALRAEPTIMAWELGNELSGMTPEWVTDISTYLHQLAPRHLVAAPGISAATLESPAVDIVDAHYYPPDAARMLADAATVTAAGKVYIAGEYGSTFASSELLAPLAADPRVTGTLFWSLFPHADDHGYVPHDDGFTLHYPGDTPEMRAAVRAIEEFNAAVNPAANRPPVRLNAPVITSLTKVYGENLLAWRGASPAVGYTVQRSTRGPRGPWRTVSTGTVTDNDTPWIDVRSPRERAWYRVVAVDARGHRQASAPARVGAHTGALARPGAFGPQSPAREAQRVAQRPTFSWSPAERAAYYTLVVSRRADLSSPVLRVTGLLATSYTVTEPLAPGVTYHWRVTATNLAGTTAGGSPTSFTTINPAVDPIPVDDFDGYDSDQALGAAYQAATSGDPITVALDRAHADSGAAMALNYTLGTQGYAGVTRTFPTAQDWSADIGLQFWLAPDAVGRNLSVQFQAAGVYWQYDLDMTGRTPGLVRIPFADFAIPTWATPGALNLAQVTHLSFYLGGTPGTGVSYVDSVVAYPR